MCRASFVSNLAAHFGVIGSALMLACRPDNAASIADVGSRMNEAVLTPVDSITLVESDSLLLGRVGQGFDVDNEGSLYVAASSFGKIIRYTAAGQPVMVYGRYGSGPGEFRHVFPVVAVAESVVLGSASFGRRVNVFRRSDGTPLATVRYAGFVTTLVQSGDTLYFGNFSRRDSAGVGAVPLGSLLSSEADSRYPLQPRLAAIPSEYYQFSELELSSDVRVARRSSDLLAAYAPMDWILVFRSPASGPDTIRVPARIRKGFDREVLSQHFVKDRYRFDTAVESLSLLEGIWVLASGEVALIHMDTRATMRGRTVVSVAASAYLTILSVDLAQACVDIPIPAERLSRPVVTVKSDRLYVLEQIVSDNPEPIASTIVRTYRIDSRTCNWVPVG